MNRRLIRGLLVLVLAVLAVLLVAPGLLFDVPPNTIRWVTQSEEDTFGYDVYRGAAQAGPFERINTATILGAGTTDIPQRYEYADANIAPDTMYWYYVETIALTGERALLTPVYPSRPKSLRPW